MLIKLIKFIVLPILHLIRRVLNVFVKHGSPNYSRPPLRSYTSAFNYHLKDEELKNYENFKKYFKNSIFLNEGQIKEYSIKQAIQNDKEEKKFYLEFGVFQGKSINLFSKFLNGKIYGFDSFEGLKEDWAGSEYPKGYFDLQGKKPSVEKNVILIKGFVQDTLENFLNDKKPKVNFIHIDLDTYESTKFVLDKIKPYLEKGTIILFDEIYNFPGWEVGEYKALTEIFKENEYKFLAFSKDGCQAVIKII